MTDPDDTLPTEPADTAGPAAEDRPAAPRSGLPAAPSGASPLPFEDLRIPSPTRPAPPLGARLLAFGSILVGGLLGGLIGYGTADLLSGAVVWVIIGLLVGALAGAIGVGVVAGLTLRAMNEWTATAHPEAVPRRQRRGFELRSQVRGRSGPGSGTRG